MSTTLYAAQGSTINASGYLIPFVEILLVAFFAGLILWVLGRINTDPMIKNIVTIAVVVIACIIILFILLAMLGVHVT